MPTTIQRSFSGGEIAPALYGRVDTVKYATGLRTCRNFMVMRHGGASSRAGTEFVAEVSDSTKKTRFIKFVFNSSQTYVLEFGDQYMRVHQDGVQLSDLSLTITAISQANPGVVTYTGTDPANGDEVYISGVNGMTELNGRSFKIGSVNTVANTFQLKDMTGTNFNTSSLTAYNSGGTADRVYQISTPYIESDLADLQYVQSADVITIVHPSYAPRELSRIGHTSWSLSTITFDPGISAPTGLTSNYTAGSTYVWVVTAVADETFEESLPSSSTDSSTDPSVTPVTLSWNTVSGAREYNIYKQKNGVFGLIGVAGSTSFVDDGIDPNVTETPPIERDPFSGTDDYPSAVSYIQQRRCFGNTNNNPEKVYMSQIGRFTNFTVSSPLQDDDSVTFNLAGRQVNSIKHLLDLGKLIVLTSGGEWAVTGDSAGIIRPGEINPKQYTYYGSNSLSPLIIGESALFIQARGGIVRDLAFDFQSDGYKGNDLTIFSAHLVDGYTIVDWDFQQIPHSIVWLVRSDGVLLGLTYLREQQILAWHRHDFDGLVEKVCCVPEGNEDAVYLLIKRTINGRSVRYIERMTQRRVDDIVDFVGMDCSLTYDGRNTNGSHTMTLTGSGWTYESQLTLTSSASYFSSADIGNQIQLTGSDGTEIRFTITGYSSATAVTGKPNKTVPAGMRSVAISDWAKAVDELSGLWHLEGKDVSIFADAFVVANPNNDSYVVQTVENGTITLDKPYAVIHVGLPYTCDLQTLDIDTSDAETLIDKKKNISKVTLMVESSRGIFASGSEPSDDSALSEMNELKIRNSEGYDDPVALITGPVDINIQQEWNSNGRVFIRQSDPLPLSVLTVAPAGLFH